MELPTSTHIFHLPKTMNSKLVRQDSNELFIGDGLCGRCYACVTGGSHPCQLTDGVDAQSPLQSPKAQEDHRSKRPREHKPTHANNNTTRARTHNSAARSGNNTVCGKHDYSTAINTGNTTSNRTHAARGPGTNTKNSQRRRAQHQWHLHRQ